jgi:uncharacterized membrane protein YecN with MAPEG domain
MARSESPKAIEKIGQEAEVGSVAAGLPEVNTSSSGYCLGVVMFSAFLTVPRVIGMCLSYVVYRHGSRKIYESRIKALGPDVGYLYLAAALFGFCTAWLNNYPTILKGAIMRVTSGNLRANMMIFKEAGRADSPYVILETEGPVGSYNRANRSLTHFIENSLPVVLCLVLAGPIFPFPAFVLTAIFTLGRILHQLGYSVGYGVHAPGFMLAMVSSVTLEMLCLFIALKSMGVITAHPKGDWPDEL